MPGGIPSGALPLDRFDPEELKKAVDAERQSLKAEKAESDRNQSLDDIAVRYATGIRGPFQHTIGCMRKFPGSHDDHDAAGKQKEQNADQIDPGPAFCSQALIDDVDPHVAVLKKCVSGSDQKDKGEQVPLEFLGENETDIEEVAHHDIGENHQNQTEAHPGDPPSDPLVNRVDNAGQRHEYFHLEAHPWSELDSFKN
jgi:hypothetical protein